MGLSLVVADDHKVVRQGLCSLLDTVDGFRVVGQAVDGIETVRVVERRRPDVLVMDYTMPTQSGPETIRRVVQSPSPPRVVVLSVHNNEGYVVEALRAGAVAYVLKESDSEVLIRAIREAAARRRFIDPAISPRSLQEYLRKMQGPARDPLEALTAREREVFQLTAEGNSGVDVANRLFISPRTVETHRANVLRKLGLRNHKELIRYAAQRDMLPGDKTPPGEKKGL